MKVNIFNVVSLGSREDKLQIVNPDICRMIYILCRQGNLPQKFYKKHKKFDLNLDLNHFNG